MTTWQIGSAMFSSFLRLKQIIESAFPFDQADGNWKCPYCNHTYRWAQTHIWKRHVRIVN